MKSLFNIGFFFTCLSAGLQAEEALAEPLPHPLVHAQLQFTIEPKARAQDYLQAFSFLRQEKTAGKVAFLLKDGSSISNIIDIHLMDQGSLLISRYNSAQGIKFRVVCLEEILRVEHL